MKYLSLFSGIGGFELGIQRAFDTYLVRHESERAERSSDKHSANPTSENGVGRQQRALCVGYSEIDKYAIKVYERNFDGHTNYGDATTINATELPDFDLLVGGFPCQAFSIAGKRAGFDDTRGTLFFDIARILKEKQPRHLVLENVKGLLSHDGGRTFTTIIGVLSDLGYFVEWQVLNSKDFGVPQNRERVFIVGHLGNECRGKVFPIRQDGRGIAKGQSTVSRTIQADTEGLNQPNTNEPILQDGQDRPIHQRIRKLTPIECERLQGFPDNWTSGESDTQRYKMCGNAVTVNTVEAVMKSLLNHSAPISKRTKVEK